MKKYCPNHLLVKSRERIKKEGPKLGTFSLVLSVVALFVLTGGFALLAALHAGALIVLLLAEIGQNAGLSAAALEALESVVQRLVLLDVDFRRHCIPSLQNVLRRCRGC